MALGMEVPFDLSNHVVYQVNYVGLCGGFISVLLMGLSWSMETDATSIVHQCGFESGNCVSDHLLRSDDTHSQIKTFVNGIFEGTTRSEADIFDVGRDFSMTMGP